MINFVTYHYILSRFYNSFQLQHHIGDLSYSVLNILCNILHHRLVVPAFSTCYYSAPISRDLCPSTFPWQRFPRLTFCWCIMCTENWRTRWFHTEGNCLWTPSSLRIDLLINSLLHPWYILSILFYAHIWILLKKRYQKYKSGLPMLSNTLFLILLVFSYCIFFFKFYMPVVLHVSACHSKTFQLLIHVSYCYFTIFRS